MMNKKAGLPALVLLAALAGCAQDAEQPSQPKAGVLTVTGVEDGISYEADVYDWPNAVADADDLNGIIGDAEPDGTGTGTADNETLEIDLETPDGEVFTSDGKFLVVLKDAEDDSAPFKYKTFVRFTGGRATVKYSTMKSATVEPSGTDDPNGTDEPSVSMYTVTFHTNGGTPADFIQQVQSGGKATLPAPPTRQGYTFDGWYKDEALNTLYNFDSTISADITLYARWKPLTFAAAIVYMAETANSTTAAYTLPSGDEAYNAEVTLTTANSPASVTIDGGGSVITGSANRFTVGSGVTLTLKNITFKKVPFTAAADGTLVLDDGAVVTENTGTGVTVNGTSAAAKGTLEMKAGASITLNGDSGVRLEETGVFIMSGGTISGNTVPIIAGEDTGGGGVALTGTDSEFTMSGGTISDNEAANGGGVALTGTGGSFTMSGGTISDNEAANGGGVALTGTGGSFTMSGGEISYNSAITDCGGVAMLGTNNEFTMSAGTISGNTASNDCGGVAMLGEDSKFTMNGGTISGNTAPAAGGGVGLWGTNNKFTITAGGTISDNITNDNGGGVAVWGTKNEVTMSGGTISGNNTFYGGGIELVGSNNTVTMSGGTISGNTANHIGGGVDMYESNNTFTMSGGIISGNTASNDGGGVLADGSNNNTFNMTGGEITGNIAGGNGGGVFVAGTGVTFTGSPQIGSKNSSKGSIYSNTATQNPATNDVSN